MDICDNAITTIVFCDEEGYDIVPLHIHKVVLEVEETEVNGVDKIEAR